MTKIYNISNLRDRRKKLRKNTTLQEKILWDCIRNDKLGYRFRRQFSVGGYILDFYCPKRKIGIEIDGGIHNTKEAKEYDQIRDKFLVGLGFTILRFSNEQIEKSIEFVLEKIRQSLKSKFPLLIRGRWPEAGGSELSCE